MARKITKTIKYMSYRGHQIFFDKELRVYMVAIKRDGTDDYFLTSTDAMDAIDNVFYGEKSK